RRGHGRLQQGLGEGALSAVPGRRDDAAGEPPVGAAGAARRVGLDPRQRSGRLRRRGGVAGGRGVVAEEAGLDVGGQLFALLNLLPRQFRRDARVIHRLLSAGDVAQLLEDLGAVAHAGGDLGGRGGGHIALHVLVVARGRAEGEGLPLVIGGLNL